MSFYRFNTKKKSKYGSIKVDGYDSMKEKRRADTLKILQNSGHISELKEQVSFNLCPAQYVIGFNGKQICARREMKYIADFTYIKEGQYIVEDCKGFRTDKYKQKKRLMKRIYNIEIFET